MKPICRTCHRTMRCKQNDFVVADRAMGAFHSTYWLGDLWECTCGAQIVTGFGKPIHYTDANRKGLAGHAEIFDYD